MVRNLLRLTERRLPHARPDHHHRAGGDPAAGDGGLPPQALQQRLLRPHLCLPALLFLPAQTAPPTAATPRTRLQSRPRRTRFWPRSKRPRARFPAQSRPAPRRLFRRWTAQSRPAPRRFLRRRTAQSRPTSGRFLWRRTAQFRSAPWRFLWRRTALCRPPSRRLLWRRYAQGGRRTPRRLLWRGAFLRRGRPARRRWGPRRRAALSCSDRPARGPVLHTTKVGRRKPVHFLCFVQNPSLMGRIFDIFIENQKRVGNPRQAMV